MSRIGKDDAVRRRAVCGINRQPRLRRGAIDPQVVLLQRAAGALKHRRRTGDDRAARIGLGILMAIAKPLRARADHDVNGEISIIPEGSRRRGGAGRIDLRLVLQPIPSSRRRRRRPLPAADLLIPGGRIVADIHIADGGRDDRGERGGILAVIRVVGRGGGGTRAIGQGGGKWIERRGQDRPLPQGAVVILDHPVGAAIGRIAFDPQRASDDARRVGGIAVHRQADARHDAWGQAEQLQG